MSRPSAIRIGRTVDQTRGYSPLILCEDESLRPHVDQPWFRAYIQERLGPVVDAQQRRSGEAVSISDHELAIPALFVGSPGGGKTRAMRLLLLSQIAHRRCSLVALDPKGELYDDFLDTVVQAGYPPEHVVLLDPRATDRIPGWNPFLSGLESNHVANDVAGLVERSSTTRGPRMMNLLQMGLIVIAAHRLSLFEFTRLLVHDTYRTTLLQQAVSPQDEVPYDEARSYFL